MIQTKVLASSFCALLVLGGALIAQAPKENVSKGLHPNLAKAQRQSKAAYESIVAAQEANEWDLAGHAQKAKDLLDQVNNELKLAAQTANQNKKK
jgi:hypothetical protein